MRHKMSVIAQRHDVDDDLILDKRTRDLLEDVDIEQLGFESDDHQEGKPVVEEE